MIFTNNYSRINHGNVSGSVTIDWTQGKIQRVVPTGTAALTFTPPSTGYSELWLLMEMGAESISVSVTNSTVKWDSARSTFSTVTGYIDLWEILYDGTNYYISVFKNMLLQK